MSRLEKSLLWVALAVFAAVHLGAALMMPAVPELPESARVAALLAHGGD
jgi:hypothetical protein